jgi:N-dimethylarginine dimethylaminohydrolase
MSTLAGAQSDAGTIERMLVRHVRDAFVEPAKIQAEWRQLGFTAPPDLDRAIGEYDAFLATLRRSGATIDALPASPDLTLDSVYVRDASIVSDRGVILCRMGKPQRKDEPAAHARYCREAGLSVLGAIEPPGTLEGGDFVWLDGRAAAVGLGYRTNSEGVRQLRALLDDAVDELIEVPLPHWKGPDDVFHLMSIFSPVMRDLAVVYSPLLPVPFRQLLLARGISLIEVPDEEFGTMGANVLAIGPRHALMVGGNPRTRGLLEAAGIEVVEYAGAEISLLGGGGPTCLTRPLSRRIDVPSRAMSPSRTRPSDSR